MSALSKNTARTRQLRVLALARGRRGSRGVAGRGALGGAWRGARRGARRRTRSGAATPSTATGTLQRLSKFFVVFLITIALPKGKLVGGVGLRALRAHGDADNAVQGVFRASCTWRNTRAEQRLGATASGLTSPNLPGGGCARPRSLLVPGTAGTVPVTMTGALEGAGAAAAAAVSRAGSAPRGFAARRSKRR